MEGTAMRSMTGFGRCEVSEGDRKMTVEMKSVNHRYLDVSIKMPKKLNYFESAIRSLLKSYIQRGKVDVFITYEDLSESTVSLRYNHTLAAEYLKYLKEYVASCSFQILGHPDLPKKFGFRPVESESFLQRFSEIFEMAASRGIALELNTAGLHVPVREIYPSKTLLSLAKRAGMKITYGSDAHAPEAVGRDFAAAEQLAKECGFSGFVTFEKRRPIDLPFS